MQQLIPAERLRHILTQTRRVEQRECQVSASSTVWLVLAMSLYATHSIPMVWRALHPFQSKPDPDELPAKEAASLYHVRWDHELVFDEIKTHLNGREVHLRSTTPRGVGQELYGLFLAHRIIRQVMSDAARPKDLEANRLSFTDSLRILQSQLHEAPSCPTAVWYQRLTEEVGRQVLRPRRNRWYPRVIRRKMKKWGKKQPHHRKSPQPTKTFADAVVIT